MLSASLMGTGCRMDMVNMRCGEMKGACRKCRGMVGMTMKKRRELETMSLATLRGGNVTVRMDEDNGEMCWFWLSEAA